ncbi:MAG: alpha/beta hydrolase [Deltaproteobacteria bacterium]|nr:alpha/beta hydrolase [Deltaproteobacteria bacterium]
MRDLPLRRVVTPRGAFAVREVGPAEGRPLILVHGNVSSGRFFSAFAASLVEASGGRLRVIAPDLRGYGDTEAGPIDATRGVRDLSDDLIALAEALELDRAAWFGWSMGAAVVMQLTIDRPGLVTHLILQAPVSPVGFGGTQGVHGGPNAEDFAGSGGGVASPDFCRLLAQGDRSADAQQSPRSVLRAFYFKPGFALPEDEEDALVDAMIKGKLGPGYYPGDFTPSTSWPGVAPGDSGINNAISPKHLDLRAFGRVKAGPPVLWIRGADDSIVSDNSAFDLAYLGSLGFVPGWPGAETCPPQPMVTQMKAVLDEYAQAGGQVDNLVLPDCGHSPHIERPDEVRAELLRLLG